MNDVVDIIRLLRLIQGYSAKITQYTLLVEQMRAEGRDTLTPDELESLQADDDSARDALVDALRAENGQRP